MSNYEIIQIVIVAVGAGSLYASLFWKIAATNIRISDHILEHVTWEKGIQNQIGEMQRKDALEPQLREINNRLARIEKLIELALTKALNIAT